MELLRFITIDINIEILEKDNINIWRNFKRVATIAKRFVIKDLRCFVFKFLVIISLSLSLAFWRINLKIIFLPSQNSQGDIILNQNNTDWI